MSRKKRLNKVIRKKYQVTGEQLIQEGKLDPYHHLKDWVDILEERKNVNHPKWWMESSFQNL
jgi:hypothetical protein